MPQTLWRKNNKLLRVDRKLARDERCCAVCDPSSSGSGAPPDCVGCQPGKAPRFVVVHLPSDWLCPSSVANSSVVLSPVFADTQPTEFPGVCGGPWHFGGQPFQPSRCFYALDITGSFFYIVAFIGATRIDVAFCAANSNWFRATFAATDCNSHDHTVANPFNEVNCTSNPIEVSTVP